LFRLDIVADNVTLTPVNFPAVTTKITGGGSVASSAGFQALMESNELVHQVTFGSATAKGRLISTSSDYPIDGTSISNIQITDAKTKAVVKVKATGGTSQGLAGGSTLTFQVAGDLKPGDYVLSFQYTETNHPQLQSASVNFSVPAS
jgi:hypothetical protein